MSLAKPSQCVFCLFRRSTRVKAPSRRTFRATTATWEEKGNGKKKDDDDPNSLALLATESRKVDWSKYYSPAQVAAIEAAQDLIPADTYRDGPGARRSDPLAPDYTDDLADIRPDLDKPLKKDDLGVSDNMPGIHDIYELPPDDDLDQLKEQVKQKGWSEALARARKYPNIKQSNEELKKYLDPSQLIEVNKIETALADIGNEDEDEKPAKGGKEFTPKLDAEAASPALIRLMQMTGMDKNDILRLRVKSVLEHRVVNQTRLGKVGRTYVLSVAGNQKGLVGIGEGKSENMMDAKLQSQYRAIRSMQPILRYENRTTFGDVKGKVGATELELFARPPGMLYLTSERAYANVI